MRAGSSQKGRQPALRHYDADLISRYIEAEWYHLKSAIQSRDRNQCLTALDIINVLKKKFGSGLPLVLRATETALHAAIFDQKYESEIVDDDHGLSETISRFTFSFALSRFIGLIFELSVTRSFVSLTDSMESIGIPRWIVRARNEAAHGHLPPVTILRKALDFSLSWFNDVCWSGDSKLCISVHKVKSSRKRFALYVAALNRYIRLRHQLCSSKLTPSNKLIRKTNAIEQRIRHWLLLDRDQFFRGLFAVSFKPACEMLGEKGRDAGYLLKLWKSVLFHVAEALLLPNLLWTISDCVATDARLIPAQADGELAIQWLLKLVADEDFSNSVCWDSAFQLLISEAPYGNKELLTRVVERCQLSSEKMEILKKLEDMQYLSTSSAIVLPELKAQTTMPDEDIKRYRLSQENINAQLPQGQTLQYIYDLFGILVFGISTA